MGGGNGAKAAQKRERAQKDAKAGPQSQLKAVCLSHFIMSLLFFLPNCFYA